VEAGRAAHPPIRHAASKSESAGTSFFIFASPLQNSQIFIQNEQAENFFPSIAAFRLFGKRKKKAGDHSASCFHRLKGKNSRVLSALKHKGTKPESVALAAAGYYLLPDKSVADRSTVFAVKSAVIAAIFAKACKLYQSSEKNSFAVMSFSKLLRECC
jgi:hypothetical protein